MLLTRKQAAERLKIDYNQITYLINRGYLPVYRTTNPRKTWIKEDELQAFIAKRPDFAQRLAA